MKKMKSFRPYWSRGRIPTKAGYLVAFAGVGAVVVAYGIMLIWGSEIPRDIHRPVAWGFVLFGLLVSGIVGAQLQRQGIPLSRKDD